MHCISYNKNAGHHGLMRWVVRIDDRSPDAGLINGLLNCNPVPLSQKISRMSIHTHTHPHTHPLTRTKIPLPTPTHKNKRFLKWHTWHYIIIIIYILRSLLHMYCVHPWKLTWERKLDPVWKCQTAIRQSAVLASWWNCTNKGRLWNEFPTFLHVVER